MVKGPQGESALRVTSKTQALRELSELESIGLTTKEEAQRVREIIEGADQREALIEAEKERQRAADPERAAAIEQLARIREAG